MFNFICKIRYWFKYRKEPKLFVSCVFRSREDIQRLFPNSESPLFELTKRLNTPGAIVPDPEFKFFGEQCSKK